MNDTEFVMLLKQKYFNRMALQKLCSKQIP